MRARSRRSSCRLLHVGVSRDTRRQRWRHSSAASSAGARHRERARKNRVAPSQTRCSRPRRRGSADARPRSAARNARAHLTTAAAASLSSVARSNCETRARRAIMAADRNMAPAAKRRRIEDTPCVACEAKRSRYRCTGCPACYCSLPCFKIHKSSCPAGAEFAPKPIGEPASRARQARGARPTRARRAANQGAIGVRGRGRAEPAGVFRGATAVACAPQGRAQCVAQQRAAR